MARFLPSSLLWAIGVSVALHLAIFWQAIPFVRPRLSAVATSVQAVLTVPPRAAVVPPRSSSTASRAPVGAPMPKAGDKARGEPRVTATPRDDLRVPVPVPVPPTPTPTPTPTIPPAQTVPAVSDGVVLSGEKRLNGPADALPPPTPGSVRDSHGAVVTEPAPRVDAVGGTPSRHANAAPSGVDADEMRQYPFDLRVMARRFKRYPALARENGWQGTVDLELVFHAAVDYPSVEVLHSSGHDVLDEQAREMILRAVRATPVPASFRRRDLRMRLPVEFSLEDAQ